MQHAKCDNLKYRRLFNKHGSRVALLLPPLAVRASGDVDGPTGIIREAKAKHKFTEHRTQMARAVLIAEGNLDEAHLAEKYFRSAMLGECGLVRIGFGIASLATGLPDLIQRFRSRFPGVEVAMREMSTPAQLDALENRTLDFGFVRIPASSQELVVWPLFQDRLVLAIGPHTGGRARGGLASFSREPFIGVARSASASLFDHVLRTCRAAGFAPRIVQEVSEIFTALNFVRAGAGVALVPRSSRVMRVPGIRYVETAVPAGKWKIGLAFHKSSPADPILSRFLSLVRQGYRVSTKRAD
jgi:DNA-binding transcriptional LysR family regulator